MWKGVTAVSCRELHRKGLTTFGGWAGQHQQVMSNFIAHHLFLLGCITLSPSPYNYNCYYYCCILFQLVNCS